MSSGTPCLFASARAACSVGRSSVYGACGATAGVMSGVVLPLRDEGLRAGQRVASGVGASATGNLITDWPSTARRPGLARDFGDVVLEVIHVGERRRARLDHLERGQPRADAHELRRHGRLLGREDVLRQPVHQRQVVGQAAVQHHRRVRVRVDEAGQDDLAARRRCVSAGVELRARSRPRCPTATIGRPSIATAPSGITRPLRVHRDDGAAREEQTDGACLAGRRRAPRATIAATTATADADEPRASHRPDSIACRVAVRRNDSIACVYSSERARPSGPASHRAGCPDRRCATRDDAPSQFRRLAHRLSLLLAIEATRKLPMALARVETPLEPAQGEALDADVVVVPVLRAGLGMVDAVLELLPHARVGHIGLQRDEHTAIASRYYAKLPADLSNSTALVVDPMLATGGSAIAAIALLQKAGARDIRLLCIVAAPEGIAAVEAGAPDACTIYTPVIDRELNAQKFILPGLGDFGDRLYGTA